MAQAPWFKMFAADFLADNYVDAMTAEQVGWYTLLLLRSWNHTPRGFLPNDKQLLALWCRCVDQISFASRAGIVLDRFLTTEDGNMIYHPRLVEQSSKVAQVSEKRSLAGKTGGLKSGEKRRSKSEAIATANAKQLRTDSDSDSDVKEREIENVPDDFDEKIREVFRLHPANSHIKHQLEIPRAQADAIAGAIIRDGFDLVVAGTRNLADAVARWPKPELRFIPNPQKFYGLEAEYLKDPQFWERSEMKPASKAKPRGLDLDQLYAEEEQKLGKA